MFLVCLRKIEACCNLLNGVRVLGEMQKHAACTNKCGMVAKGCKKCLKGCNSRDTRIVGSFVMESLVSLKLTKDCGGRDLHSFYSWAMDTAN